MKRTRTNFRVGDRVYDVRHGWGIVESIDFDVDYPIDVAYDNGSSSTFTQEGKALTFDSCRFLFFVKPTITPECLEKEEDEHIITIDGKEVKLSEESFQALKEQFK